MSELPKGWECVSLINFVYSVPTGVPNFSGKRNYYSTGSINGINHTSEGEYSYDNRPSRANRIALKDDVFQARMQNTDKALLIQESMADQLFSTGFLQLRPIANTYDSKLLFNFVKSDYFLKQRDEFATGSTQIALTDTNAIKLKLIVPPLSEQRRIVAKLERLLHRVDACKERLEKIPAILKRFRQSILAAACSGRLTTDWRERNPDVESAEKLLKKIRTERINTKTMPDFVDFPELPSNWVYATIGEVTNNIKYGTAQKCSYEKTGVPVLRIPNISAGVIDISDLKYADLPENEYNQLKLAEGDILLIRSNGSVSLVGKSAIIKNSEKGFAYAGYLIRIRFDKLVSPSYINHILSSSYTRDQIEIPARSTSGVHNINSEEVKNLIIPLPPIKEQHEIVRRVEALFKKADEIEVRYKKAKAFVNKLTQSILAKAFRGELVPQDPNDEPALVLLERIKVERAKQEPKRRGKKVAHDA